MWPAFVLKQDPESFVFRNRFILTHFESLSGWWTRILGRRAGMALSTMLLWWVNQHPLSRRTTGDGISVRSLCWASHVCLYPGQFPTEHKMEHSIIFRGFSHECPLSLFFFWWGLFPGFQQKVNLFLGQTTKQQHGLHILSFPFCMGCSPGQDQSSPCSQALLVLSCGCPWRSGNSGIDGLMGLMRLVKGWCGRLVKGFHGGRCVNIYSIYIYRYSHGNGKKHVKNNGCLPFWMMINQYEKRWCFKKTDM